MNLELPLMIIEPETHSFDVVDCIGRTVCCDLSREECEFIVKSCNYFDAQEFKIKNLELKISSMNKAVEALQNLEWSGCIPETEISCCPSCGATERSGQGHHLNCEIAPFVKLGIPN